MPEKNFIFSYSTQKVGGAQLLFARLASRLCRDKKKVTIVSKTLDFISDYLNTESAEYIHVKVKEGNQYQTSPNDVVILSASFINITHDLFDLDDDTKLFYWELHPYALIEQLGFSKVYKNSSLGWLSKLLLHTIERRNKKILEAFITEASEANGFVFMCGKNYEFNRQFFSFSQSKFLPIPIMMNNDISAAASVPKKNSDIVKICWLGRISTQKIQLVELILKDLQLLDNVAFSVIGSGNSIASLKSISEGYDFKVDFVGTLSRDKLNAYIRENVDVGIAIGTSSLEFAKLGVPTLIMPGVDEFQKFNDRKYDWLSNSRNFDLCTTLRHNNRCRSMSEVIDEYRQNSHNLGESSLEYAKTNHSFDSIYLRFEKIIEEDSFAYQDAKRIGLFDLNNSLALKAKRSLKKIV